VPPPAVTTPALPTGNAAATALGFPSAKRCASRRVFRIRLRSPKGIKLVDATVRVNGRKVQVLRGRRLSAPVDLRGLPKGRFTVKITARTADGRTITATRRYRTCAPKTKPTRAR